MFENKIVYSIYYMVYKFVICKGLLFGDYRNVANLYFDDT